MDFFVNFIRLSGIVCWMGTTKKHMTHKIIKYETKMAFLRICVEDRIYFYHFFFSFSTILAIRWMRSHSLSMHHRLDEQEQIPARSQNAHTSSNKFKIARASCSSSRNSLINAEIKLQIFILAMRIKAIKPIDETFMQNIFWP